MRLDALKRRLETLKERREALHNQEKRLRREIDECERDGSALAEEIKKAEAPQAPEEVK